MPGGEEPAGLEERCQAELELGRKSEGEAAMKICLQWAELRVSPTPTSSVGGWNTSPATSLEALGTLGSGEVDEGDDRHRWSEESLWPGQWEGGGRRDRGGTWGGEGWGSLSERRRIWRDTV